MRNKFAENVKKSQAEHPGVISLYRVGDFYEVYFDDAVELSKSLGLTLTTQNPGKPEAMPMAGFPHHQLEAYLKKLIQMGKRVAMKDAIKN